MLFLLLTHGLPALLLNTLGQKSDQKNVNCHYKIQLFHEFEKLL